MKNLTEILRGNAAIIDVRTAGEFAGGHVKGSINIPLNELQGRMDEFRDLQPLVLCCASGNRSGMAAMILQQQGITCVNGGSWYDVNNLKNN